MIEQGEFDFMGETENAAPFGGTNVRITDDVIERLDKLNGNGDLTNKDGLSRNACSFNERRDGMKIESDDYSFVNETMVERGLARIAPNRVTISGDAESNTRLINAIAQQFRVYQWDESIKPYTTDYDLFFWCNDFYNTEGHDMYGNDMRYFTLNTNDRTKSIEERTADYDRLRKFLMDWDGTQTVRFTYRSENDEEAIKKEGMRILAGIKQGQTVWWKDMPGKVKFFKGFYYFMKRGARKYGYMLEWTDILQIKKEVANA